MTNLLILLQDATTVHEGAKKIVELDPIGIGMTVIAMSVVFLSLLIFYLVFKNIAKVYGIDLKKRFNKKKGIVVEEQVVTEDPTSELGAAVALALYYYQNELHDYENTLLTIAKVGRTYSPWSSKIYGLRKSPK
ncbi:MAG TPA: OadG family protein [Bacteroidales bacterium]|nr:OadG family protein [Bacteroidales bacterium]